LASSRTRKRQHPVAAKTENLRRLPKNVRFLADYPEEAVRPRTRGECGHLRPCPYVSCRFHLYLDVLPTGNLKLNFPDLEPWQLHPSCALDVADRGPHGHEAVGAAINVTFERARQIEESALAKLKKRGIES